GLLWIWLVGSDEFAYFDGNKWKTMRMPEPKHGLSRGNLLEGFRGISNAKTFWIEGAWHAWAWEPRHSKWIEAANAPVFSTEKSVQVLNRLAPTDERLLFVMHRDQELLYSDSDLQLKLKGDVI